jgi:predicted alpha/beta hydrolase
MNEIAIQIPTSDGFSLSGIIYEYRGNPKAVVQFNIGTGMRKEFYSNLARFLAEQGFIVCLWEYRGMGQSRPMDKAQFSNITMQDWAVDMSEVLDFLEHRYPDWPKLMIGHSIGGQLVGLMPNHHLLKGMLMLTCSTGTWWHHTFPYRLKSYYFFNIISPLTVPFWGYLPAKRMKIMEDLPKGLIMEWRSWCNSENYLFEFLGKTIPANYYEDIRISIRSYWTTDDPIANARSVSGLLRHFRNADIMNEAIRPKDFGVKNIGHFGLFSRKFKDSFWTRIVKDLEEMLLKNHHYNNPSLKKVNL